MSAHRASNSLTTRQEKAAALLAVDSISDVEIAAKCGITDRSLNRWKSNPQFAARVQKLRDEAAERIREEVITTGIADRVNRVKRLNDDWIRMQQVIKERGESAEMEEIPGGQTGLLVRQIKGIGKGEDFQIVEMYAVDAALLSQLTAHEAAAAKELGQTIDRHEIDVRDTTAADSLDRKLAGLAARIGAPPVPSEPEP